ncbi:hypothetical protein CRENBAI_001700 [Crenichthys baileyi]|uniref:Uncharacterized protein n=1 Tax=Crenichthys baileyi TaxID=28760 RepID=A0AAV9SCL4_9TELE
MQSEALRKIQTKVEEGISREGEKTLVFHREQEQNGIFNSNSTAISNLNRFLIVYGKHVEAEGSVAEVEDKKFEILQRRNQFGEYYHLLQELRLDEGRFKQYFRLSRTQFEDLLPHVRGGISLWDTSYKHCRMPVNLSSGSGVSVFGVYQVNSGGHDNQETGEEKDILPNTGVLLYCGELGDNQGVSLGKKAKPK